MLRPRRANDDGNVWTIIKIVLVPNALFRRISGSVLVLFVISGCGNPSFSNSKLPVEVAEEISVPGIATRFPEPYLIEITGTNYRWRVRYPGMDGTLGTIDDVIRYRDVHLPLETEVQLVLKSTDYVYGISLPEFKKREIAVPKLEFRIGIRPLASGTFILDGDEFCGDPHPELKGFLIVESREQFRQWLGQQPPENPGDSRDPSQSVYNKRRVE